MKAEVYTALLESEIKHYEQEAVRYKNHENGPYDEAVQACNDTAQKYRDLLSYLRATAESQSALQTLVLASERLRDARWNMDHVHSEITFNQWRELWGDFKAEIEKGRASMKA